MKHDEKTRNHASGATDTESATAVVEVKKRLQALRTLRDAMVQIAALLAREGRKTGYILLVDPLLSSKGLADETERFKAALRPDVADRIHLILAEGGRLPPMPGKVSPEDEALLRRCLRESGGSAPALPLPVKQHEVLLLVLHQWVTGQGPMTSKWLGKAVGCNYRTVSAALDRLGPAISRRSDRRVSLKYFPEREWQRLAVVAHKVRATIQYTDTSDQPRSPESLLRRLVRLGRKDIAVGGVIGAKHYYEDLDIVGTPRLDLCIHSPGGLADLDFIRELDPALEPTRDPHRPVRLALHFLRRKKPFFDPNGNGLPRADPVECLVELCIAGLDPQAAGFQDFLAMRGRELSGGL